MRVREWSIDFAIERFSISNAYFLSLSGFAAYQSHVM